MEQNIGKSNTTLWLLITGLSGFAVGLIIIAVIAVMQPPSAALLAIGDHATLTDLPIPLKRPIELDGLTKAEVYALRTEAVTTYPDLLTESYTPSEAVFGQIVDGLPWWGLVGAAYYGSGQYSIDGPSEESRFIMNPYLLVAADFYGLGNASAEGFNFTPLRLTDEILRSEDFPTYCPPSDLHWFPTEARAEVTYHVTFCKQRVQPYVVDPDANPHFDFDLISYNARDLGLGYVWVAYNSSTNISHPNPPTGVYEIEHFIHQGGSCGYGSGCNNMSPATPAIDRISIDALPARMIVWLWHTRPATIANPDFTFTLFFD